MIECCGMLVLGEPLQVLSRRTGDFPLPFCLEVGPGLPRVACLAAWAAQQSRALLPSLLYSLCDPTIDPRHMSAS